MAAQRFQLRNTELVRKRCGRRVCFPPADKFYQRHQTRPKNQLSEAIHYPRSTEEKSLKSETESAFSSFPRCTEAVAGFKWKCCNLDLRLQSQLLCQSVMKFHDLIQQPRELGINQKSALNPLFYW